MLNNSIATKDNLLRRGVSVVSCLCELSGEEEETVCHLFFKCKFVWKFWGLCLSWLGCLSVNHYDANVHFRMFLVWIAIVGEILKHRNKCVFNNSRVDHIEVFTVVQRKT
uniref:Reverse transcriptase zinc-binding domain-containing protein n=1 Tax=Phaseolus vulgaris TaxID=3885 RepID=V7BTD5_PHAVU|nr:hypothetical protein PHAVU_005G051200g [Phaseolus vulgaris]ESW21209.1 hypothetical protein PHAVU_005G051200g [Phaseolus vulgaris]